MIQRINDVSDILAEVAVDIIRFLEQLRCLVYQVGGQNEVKHAGFISLVKFLQCRW